MKPLKYIAYTRKSTEDPERQVLSTPAQIAKVKEMFPELKVVDFIEEHKSAFEPNNRPKFDAVMDRLRNNEIQGIIAWHPNRLSRNEVEAATITYMLRKGVIQDLKFCSYNFDNSPEGIWMLQMALSQGQYESAKLSKDVKRGNEAKLKAGGPTGLVPGGYLNKLDDHSAISDPERFRLVRRMWDLMLTGDYSVPQICKIANDQWGYRTLKRKKVGGVTLNPSTLYAMFNNLFYAGIYVRNGIHYQGTHKPMITLEEFDRVQTLLGKKGRPRPKTHELAYTGYIHCGECGCMVTAEIKLKYIKSKGLTHKYTYYHCTHKKKDYKCTQRGGLREEKLEDQMRKMLMSYTILPQFYDWGMKAIQDRHPDEVDDRNKIYAMQNKAIEQTQAQLDRLDDMASRGTMTEDRYAKKSKEVEQELKKLKSELRDTEFRAESWHETMKKAIYTCATAKERFDKGDWRTRRQVLLELGQNPILLDGKLQLQTEIWFQPIADNYHALEAEYLKVRTMPQQMQKAAYAAINSKWQG